LRSGVAAVVQTLLANVFVLGLNFGTGIITARLLGAYGRGELAAMILWPQFLSHALTLGLPHSLVFNLKRYSDRASQFFSASLILGACMGVVAVAVGFLGIPYWLAEYSPAVIRFAQLSMLIAPMGLLTLLFSAILQAREEFAYFNATRYLPPLLTLLAMALLSLVHRLSPFSAALSYLLPTIPICLWVLVRLWILYRPRWHGLRLAFKELTFYGLRSYGIDLAGTLSFYLDRALLVGLVAPAAMGLYVVALSIAQILSVTCSAVAGVLAAKASARPVEEVTRLTGLATRVSATLTLIAALAFVLLGPWLLGAVYGQAFLAAATVLRFLILQVALSGITVVLGTAFMAVGRPGFVALLQGIGLGLTVPLMLILVPRYGLNGAGLALLISSAVRLILIVASFPLILRVRVPRLWPRRDDIDAILRG
jgi:O-antigen/teichoic acid export membrane protein